MCFNSRILLLQNRTNQDFDPCSYTRPRNKITLGKRARIIRDETGTSINEETERGEGVVEVGGWVGCSDSSFSHFGSLDVWMIRKKFSQVQFLWTSLKQVLR